jgi:hypothetical protein
MPLNHLPGYFDMQTPPVKVFPLEVIIHHIFSGIGETLHGLPRKYIDGIGF